MNETHIEVNPENRNLNSTDTIFLILGGLILIFTLQSLLFLSMILYSIFLYPIIGWFPQHEFIGSTVTYTMFIILVVLVLKIMFQFFEISTLKILQTIGISAGLYLVAYPIIPILWYNDRYTIPGPAVQNVFGYELPIWPLFPLLGFLVLLTLWQGTVNNPQSLKSVKIGILLFLLGVLIIVADFVASYFRYEVSHLEMWVTPFTLLPQISGIVLSIVSLFHYRYLSKTIST